MIARLLPKRRRDGKRGVARRLPTRLLQYLKRLVRFSQMDFEVALWQMVHVLFSQQRAYVGRAHTAPRAILGVHAALTLRHALVVCA